MAWTVDLRGKACGLDSSVFQSFVFIPGPSLASVLNDLPSAATLRYRGPGVLPWGTLDEDDDEGGRSLQAFAETAQMESHPSRELPWPMQARRAHRKSQATGQLASGSESRAAYWTRQLSRTKGKMKEGFQTIQPWAWTLKKIGGVLGFRGRGLGSEAGVWFPGSDREGSGNYPLGLWEKVWFLQPWSEG